MAECERLQEVLGRIEKACERAKRKPEEVTLLGATKTVPPDVIRRFYGAVFGSSERTGFRSSSESSSF